MMRRVVRAFLVWVMVIALPVQGMAASAMLFCGPGHGRTGQEPASHAPAVASHHTAGHGHDLAATDHGAHAPAVHAAPHSGASEPSAASSSDGADGLFPHHGKFSCSSCAACCSALALPASFSLPETPGPAHPLRTSAEAPVASHQPDRLDRPPRTVLA